GQQYQQQQAGGGADGLAQVAAVAPLAIGGLGIAGFFFGFGSFASESDSASFFEFFGWLFPALVLISGLVAIIGWLLRETCGAGMSAALSFTAAITMLCGLQIFGDDGFIGGFIGGIGSAFGGSSVDISAGWAYWIIF